MMPIAPMSVSAHHIRTPMLRMNSEAVTARKLKKMTANPVNTVTKAAKNRGEKKMSAPRRISRTERATKLPVRPPFGARTKEETAMTASQAAKIRTTTSALAPGQTIMRTPTRKAMTPLTMTVLLVRFRSMPQA